MIKSIRLGLANIGQVYKIYPTPVYCQKFAGAYCLIKRLKKMRRLIIILIGFELLYAGLFISIGVLQYKGVVNEVRAMEYATDMDVVRSLKKHGFHSLDVNDDPNLYHYFRSGVYSIVRI